MRIRALLAAGPILAAGLAAEPRAQEAYDNDILAIASTINGWRGTVWRKGERFRCRRMASTGQARHDRAACREAIACYKRELMHLVPPTSGSQRWRQVGPVLGFVRYGDCAWDSDWQSEH